MNIFLRELKSNRKSLIIWGIGMFLMIASGMSKYTTYSSSAQNSEIFNSMPYSIKALFGFASFDVTTMSGFYAFLFLYIELTAGIHAVLMGAGIISKEERDKTTEFLITKPVSRNLIITSKLLASLFNIIIINIVSLVSSIIMVSAYNKGISVSKEICIFIFSMFIVQLIFFSIGAVISSFIKNAKSSGSLSVAILLGAFVISRITDFTDRIDVINIFSPFKYFSYENMAKGQGLNIGISIFSLALILVCLYFTYIFYGKRDLEV